VKFAVAFMVVCMALASVSVARCADCVEMGAPKIVLDGVGLSADLKLNARSSALKKMIEQRAWLRLKGVEHRLAADGGVTAIKCLTNTPAGFKEFRADLQQLRADAGVLLEIWSQIDSLDNGDGTPPHYQVTFQWAAFPLCCSRDVMMPVHQGFFEREPRVAVSTLATAVDTLVVSENQLYAYALVAMGIAELSSRHFGDAYRLIDKARCFLPSEDADLAGRIDAWLTKTRELATSSHVSLAPPDPLVAGECRP
jgi:hypothetical protein